MATRKGKSTPRKRKPAKPAAPPPGDLLDRQPDVPDEPEQPEPQAAPSVIGKVFELWCELQSRPDLETARALAELSGRLEDRFRSIREQAQRIARGQEAQAALAAICPPAEVVKIASLTPRVGDEAFAITKPEATPRAVPLSGGQTLSDFFQRVSFAVVRAQEELDVESLRYAANLEGSQVPPMHFAIPNVHAEVKMGFDTTTGSGILVKLFGKPEDTTNYGESTVSFDIVASPPPPGTPPASNQLVTGPERTQVLNLVKIADDRRSRAVALRSAGEWPYLVISPGVAPTDVQVYRASFERPDEIRTMRVNDPDLRAALADLTSGLDAKTS